MKLRHYLYLVVGILTVGSSSLLGKNISYSTTNIKIPTPQEAAQQAEKLTPQQITETEIDEEIRDKLRTNPEWKEIAAAIQQDIMILKWGKGKPTNPAWKRYGAKAYPLLDYYTRTHDPDRQEYGVVGIRNLGKPYTTLWLTHHIQQRLTTPDISLVTTSLTYLWDGKSNYIENDKAWLKEFGLDNPETRERLISLAQQNLQPQSSTSQYLYNNYYQFNQSEFNKDFLESVLGDYTLYPPLPNSNDSQPPLNLPEWSKFERLTQPTPNQIKDAITYYRSLPAATQERLLLERLGEVKAGKISPIGKALFQNLAADSNSPDNAWAIAELERHGDAQGTALLQQIINGDLSKIHALTRVTGYKSQSERNTHAYYLLIGIVQKYPQSKFIKGCREYGDLTGYSYFDHVERPTAIVERNAKKTPGQETKDWQEWLNRYPNHPGADDATYHLARSLQNQNDVMGAIRLWIKLMTQPVGDGDAIYLAYPYIRSFLDVGLTTQQLEILLKEANSKPILPLLQYALSVRYARGQNYAKALQTSAGLDLTTMPKEILGSYYNYNPYWWISTSKSPVTEVQNQMQTVLTQQRQRWQRLQKWQEENTPDSQYRLASDWAGAGGWQNGYMAIWDGFRAWHLPMGECETWWVCDTKRRDANLVRQLYQDSSQNAVAISLYQKLLDNPSIPPQLREKTLYMVGATLLWQWEDHPFEETIRIHPPAGVKGKPVEDVEWEETQTQMRQNYQGRIDEIISELQLKFPQSAYIDDLLFSSYYLSGKPEYLQRIIQQYPQRDRAAAAKFLLKNRDDSK